MKCGKIRFLCSKDKVTWQVGRGGRAKGSFASPFLMTTPHGAEQLS